MQTYQIGQVLSNESNILSSTRERQYRLMSTNKFPMSLLDIIKNLLDNSLYIRHKTEKI